MILMIDNYDSFTYNIVQYLAELGADVEVVRNDEVTVSEIEAKTPTKIVISPGPCTPNEAGISLSVVQHFSGKIPILGVCLGHQTIGQAFGGEVVQAEQVMHGKLSAMFHTGEGVFTGLSSPFTATRYHSLVVSAETLPDCLEATAWTEKDGARHEIMGFKHRTLDVEGVQFHPESIMTDNGHQLLQNFLDR
jgi:anthranilate synthase component 2